MMTNALGRTWGDNTVKVFMSKCALAAAVPDFTFKSLLKSAAQK